ncbi:MAG: hypothetical protein M1840_006563 [Geoglossum simile]|nr:MAG: hypothetical protein M1840_006563 [Geoglossum simile]
MAAAEHSKWKARVIEAWISDLPDLPLEPSSTGIYVSAAPVYLYTQGYTSNNTSGDKRYHQTTVPTQPPKNRLKRAQKSMEGAQRGSLLSRPGKKRKRSRSARLHDEKQNVPSPTDRTGSAYTISLGNGEEDEPKSRGAASRGGWRSGTRKMGDLRFADPPILCEALGSGEDPLPVSELDQIIYDAIQTEGLLPANMKDLITKFLSGKGELSSGFHFARRSPTATIHRDMRLWEEVKIIRKYSCRAYELNEAESGWGASVISRILTAAVEYSPLADQVQYFDMTTARIFPEKLLPAYANGQVDFASRKIDHVFASEPSESQQTKVNNVLKTLPFNEHFINQTDYEPLKFKPIFMNLKAKIPQSSSNPLVQLAIWTAAGYNRQLELLKCKEQEPELPPIPALVVTGHHWEYYIAYRQASGAIIMQGPKHFGTTLDHIGIYGIIRGLQAIMKWGCNDWQPWFEQVFAK